MSTRSRRSQYDVERTLGIDGARYLSLSRPDISAMLQSYLRQE